MPCASVVAHVEFESKIVTQRDEGVKDAMVADHPRCYRGSAREGRRQSGDEPALFFLKPPVAHPQHQQRHHRQHDWVHKTADSRQNSAADPECDPG